MSVSSSPGPAESGPLVSEMIAHQVGIEGARTLIEHLTNSDDPVEQAMGSLVEEVANRIERMYDDARARVEGLLADAQELHDMAQRRAGDATDVARVQLEERARELLNDAVELKRTAQEQADQIISKANRHRDEVNRRIAELLDEAERVCAAADERMAGADRALEAAREKARAIVEGAHAGRE